MQYQPTLFAVPCLEREKAEPLKASPFLTVWTPWEKQVDLGDQVAYPVASHRCLVEVGVESPKDGKLRSSQ